MASASGEGDAPARASAVVATAEAGTLITRLARHWRHKIPDLVHDETGADIPLGLGSCRLRASDATLDIRLEAATEEDLGRLAEVVASHLQRFARGETLVFDWVRHGSP